MAPALPVTPPKPTEIKTGPVVSWAGIVKSAKSPPAKKSPTRSSLRLKGEDPEADPLPGTWEASGTPEIPSDFIKELDGGKTKEGVPCHSLWKIHKKTTQKKLWGFSAERKPGHFYPGQIIRAMDAIPQTWYGAPIDDTCTAFHRDGSVYAKRPPFVVLWKTKRELLCLPIRSLANSTDNFDKDQGRWQEFISVTSVENKAWKGRTPWAGPPLLYAAYTQHSGLNKNSFIHLARPVSIQMQSEMHLDMGRLGGGDYCRLVEAYMYSQNLHKQKAFEEYGQTAKLPDGNEWWEGSKDGPWKLREAQMDKKKPFTNKTNIYKLQ